MAIPHTCKRLSIPSILTNSSGAGMERNNGAVTPSIPSSFPKSLPSSVILSSSREKISPTPSNHKVKYSPSTRGLKGICRGLIRPKSPSPRHASLTLGRTSGNVTLVGSTPPSSTETTHTKDPSVNQNKAPNQKATTEALVSPSPYDQTLSNLISQIIKNRFRVDHKEFVTTWSAAELKLYERRWKKLVKNSKSAFYWPTTSFAEIPWPVLSSAVISFPSPHIIHHMNVARFFISPYLGQQKSSLDIILDEIDRWNDYELMCRVLRKVRKSDRSKVEIAWSRVVLALMEVRGELMARRRTR